MKSLILLTALALAACSTSPVERRLASTSDTAPKPEFHFDTSVYRHYFSLDTQGKRVRYAVEFRFGTDMDQEYLRNRARAAFQTAIAKTLGAENPEKGLMARFKGNLMEGVLEEFVYTLYVLKIINGTIQVDLNFFPVADDPGSFQNELANNHLVVDGARGALAKRMEQNSTDVERWKNGLALGSQAGGAVTLWLKLVDMNWDPLNRLVPKPKENAVKGYFRFRQFTTLENLNLSGLACSGPTKITSFRFQPGKKQPAVDRQVLTVDVVKSFNLKNLLPRNESLEIYPGYILPTSEGRDGLVENEEVRHGKPHKTGEVVVETTYSDKSQATHRLGSLVWTVAERKISPKSSKIRTDIKKDPWNNEDTGNTWFAQKEFLDDCSGAILDQIGITPIASSLVGGR